MIVVDEILAAGVAGDAVLALAVAAGIVDAEGVGLDLWVLVEVADDVGDSLVDDARRSEAGLPAVSVVGRGQETLGVLQREELGVGLRVLLRREELYQVVVEAHAPVHAIPAGPCGLRPTAESAEET